MLVEKWKDMLGDIKDNFEVIESGDDHTDEGGGVDTEFIVFTGPIGKTKLEFITRPVVLDKKTNYSKRIGSETQVEYIYSDDEKTHKLKAYKWDDDRDGWIEMDAKNFDEE